MIMIWDEAKVDIGEFSPEYYFESIKFINNFFDIKILPDIRLHKWDLCINVIKNGESIFSEQMRRNMIEKIEIINDHDIDKFQSKIESKRILLFDDSIKKGKTIKKILGKIDQQKPTCISIATILSPKNLLDELSPKFSRVKEIISANEIEYLGDRTSEIRYKHYLKYIEAYSKYTCLPNQDGQTHPYLLIKIKPNKGREILGNLNKYADKTISNISDDFSFIGRDNISICLKKTVLENIKEDFGCNIECIGYNFIRIFLREDAQRIIIQPIIRNYDNSDCDEDSVKQIDLAAKRAMLKFIEKIIKKEYIMDCKLCEEREFIHEA